jgi:beta propeller repeat protein
LRQRRARNNNWDIYAYDYRAKMEVQITTDPFDQERPAIFKNYIVWQDNRNGNWDIYAYDLLLGRERQITFGPEEQVNPDVSQQMIVWEERPLEGDRNTIMATYAHADFDGDGAGDTCDCSPEGIPIVGLIVPELCDGVDNDCDGEIDEEFELGESCDEQQDGCEISGETVCANNGHGIKCDFDRNICIDIPEPAPKTEAPLDSSESPVLEQETNPEEGPGDDPLDIDERIDADDKINAQKGAGSSGCSLIHEGRMFNCFEQAAWLVFLCSPFLFFSFILRKHNNGRVHIKGFGKLKGPLFSNIHSVVL